MLLPFLIALLLPLAYGFLIVWGVNYRFRMTTRRLFIFTTFFAFALGMISMLLRCLETSLSEIQ